MATGRTTPVLLAMLALVMRLVASSLPLAADPAEVARADAAAFTALLGGSICHLGDAAPADPSQHAHRDPGHDCALCPACLAFAAIVPSPTPSPAAPAGIAPVRFALPPSLAGPPALRLAHAPPTGPPVRV